MTEGEGANVTLSAEAFGCYAGPISINVVCGGLIDGAPTGIDSTLVHAVSIIIFCESHF